MIRKSLLAGAVAALAGIGAGAGAVLAGSGERSPAPAAPGPSRTALAEPAPPQEPPSEKPTVLPYATGTDGPVVTAKPQEKTKAEPLPENYDGCDHAYGEFTQCVPWTFPAGVTGAKDKCAWLAARGFQALQVRGRDRHRLDPDENGVACD